MSIVVCLLIFLSGIIQTQSNFLNENNHFSIQESSTNFTAHESIMITQDVNFTDYAFPGNGSSVNPYIIENYNITTNDVIGINVEFTTKHFVIRNCYINASQRGINIEEVTVGTAKIVNNTCIDNYFSGIRIYFSPLITIINNTCRGNRYGIHVQYSSGVTIENNTCTDIYDGIRLEYSIGAFLANNNCQYSGVGIMVWHSALVELTNNTCNYNKACGIHLISSTGAILTNNSCNYNENHGIDLSSSSGATLSNNKLLNCGFAIDKYSIDLYLTHNYVNNKILGFFVNLNKANFSEPLYGQLILINCTETVVSNQEFSNIYSGLTLNSCKDSLVIDNTFSDNAHGIIAHNSEEIFIINNTCNNNHFSGIYIYYSSKVRIESNTCMKNWYSGIYLSYCKEITIESNTCMKNWFYGIYLYYCKEITISQNSCENNTLGIELAFSESCLLTYNLLKENWEYGIFIRVGSNNTIHHNSFIDNNLNGTSQAFDSGENNAWWDVNTKRGNHWSGWKKEVPYLIDGSANSTDPYPLNEKLKKIYYESIMFIPALLLAAILLKRKRKRN